MASSDRSLVGPAVLVLLIGLTSLLPGIPAAAQGCFDYVKDFSYSPSNCSAEPAIDRVFRLQAITWKNHKYLFVDEGNEIKIFNIDSPLNPISITSSHFNIPNLGDSDYDMVSFTVCDDCRYGVANYKLATVLFDIGTGSVPNFVNVYKNFDANLVWGSFTFKHDSQQYLVASTLGTNPCPVNKSGLYQFNDIDDANNPRLQCLENGSTGPTIINGLSVANTNPPVFYMADNSFFRIYTLQTSPTVQLNYEGNGGIELVSMARGNSIDLDESAGLMAMAWADNVKIFDIGYDSGNPVSPILLSTKILPGLNTVARASLKYPILYVSEPYSSAEAQTFDVSNPFNPVSLDQQFWDPSHVWNSLGFCMLNNDAVFADGGEALYLSRYSSLQVIDPTACSGPVAPIANLSLSPQPAFPGDLLTLTNTSSSGDRYAKWITDGPSPHGSNVLGGSTTFSTSNLPLNYPLPGNMASGAVFYAHSAVETDAYPYNPNGSTPDQIRTQQVAIDRSPEATITIVPHAVVTGDSVDLTAVAEGHPAVTGGGDPFDWTITPPVGEPTIHEGWGPGPHTVVLDARGEWKFDLAVQYEHDVFGQPGAPYSDTVQEIKNISSVAASFTISPTAPLHNQTITLASNSAAQTGATLDFDWDVLVPNTQTVLYELSSCDGLHAVNFQCVLPPETLNWGTYDFRLTLTNTNNSDQDTALIEDFVVYNGDIQVDFTWAPTSPEIGQWVSFQITGIPASDIEMASWDFGGTGCDGASRYYTCVPGSVPCDLAAFRYSSGGSKTVRLTVTTTGGFQQPQVFHTVSVQNTGSCSGGSCTYTITPSSRNFTSAGGTGSITVSTQSGCSWNASETSPWISITSGSSGSGSGTVTYQVAANTGAARSATITAAGKTHTVTQEQGISCTYYLHTHQAAFAPAGGVGSFNIFASDPSCTWQATSNDSWIIGVTPSGSGEGSVSYNVTENNTPHQRIGTITVTGSGGFSDDFTIIQNHPWIPVDFDFSVFAPEIGETVTFTTDERLEVLSWSFTSSDCEGNPPVITCNGTPGTCNEVEWTWADPGVKEIILETTTGSITKTLEVQNVGSCGGTSCTYSISPSSRNFTSAGGSGTISITTQIDCAWGASENASWISITSGSSGSGNGTVTYQVAANTGPARSATITAAGKLHTVDQAEAGPCGGGVVPDDGSPENGYGWGHGSVFVQRFTPVSYPYVYTDVCVAFTQAGGDTNLSYDVLIFDDNGPSGGPGTLLASIPAVAAGVPAWLDHSFFSVEVEGAAPAIENGSVYVGVGWEDVSEIGFFVAADESLGTPQQVGYFSPDGSTWEAIASTFSNYKSLLVRADGFSPVDGEWVQVVGSIFGGGNGFGDWANLAARSMAVFAGALFVGTDNSYGGEVNLTLDGENWLLGNTPGFGDSSNDGISSLARFGDFLYASTLNPVFGTQVWRTSIPLSWAYVDGDGFGDSSNQSAPSSQVFDGHLYLGTSHPSGCEIWRSQDGLAWSQVHSNGFGNGNNQVAESMAVFGGELYVGTRNTNGAELWRSPDGFVWFAAMTGGFGSPENEAINGLVVFENALYIGVSNAVSGAQVWRTFNGSSWEQLVEDGFGDVGYTTFDAFAIGDRGLLAAVSGPSNQGLIWESADGEGWMQSSSPGFTDPENTAIGALQYWGDRVYAGTSNPTAGCEVWQGGRHPVFEDGFESGDTGAWGTVVP